MKTIRQADMQVYRNAVIDARTLSRRAVTSNPVWIAAVGGRCADAIERLIELVDQFEAIERDLVERLNARPAKALKPRE